MMLALFDSIAGPGGPTNDVMKWIAQVPGIEDFGKRLWDYCTKAFFSSGECESGKILAAKDSRDKLAEMMYEARRQSVSEHVLVQVRKLVAKVKSLIYPLDPSKRAHPLSLGKAIGFLDSAHLVLCSVRHGVPDNDFAKFEAGISELRKDIEAQMSKPLPRSPQPSPASSPHKFKLQFTPSSAAVKPQDPAASKKRKKSKLTSKRVTSIEIIRDSSSESAEVAAPASPRPRKRIKKRSVEAAAGAASPPPHKTHECKPSADAVVSREECLASLSPDETQSEGSDSN